MPPHGLSIDISGYTEDDVDGYEPGARPGLRIMVEHRRRDSPLAERIIVE